MIKAIFTLLMIAWIISALSTEYHPCKVQRFSETASRLQEGDRPRGALNEINPSCPELRESDSVSS